MRKLFAPNSVSLIGLFALLPLSYDPTAEPVASTLAQQTTPSFDFANALPQGTIAYVSLPDLDRSEKACANLAWAKLSREEEVKAFAEKPLAYAKEKGFPALWKKIKQETGEDFSFLENARIHNLDIALTGFQLPLKEGERGKLDVLVSIGLGEDAARVEALFRAGNKKHEAGKIEEIAMDGATLVVLTPAHLDEEAPLTCIAWFVHNGRFVMSLNREPAEMALKALLGKNASPTLFQDKEYQQSMSKVAGNAADFRMFLRIGDTMKQGMNAIRAKYPMPKGEGAELSLSIANSVANAILSAIEKVGVSDLGSLGMAWSAHDTVSLDQCYLSVAPGPRRGLLRMLSTKPIDRGLLAKVPKEAQSFSISSLNIASLWDTIWEVAESADGEKTKKAKEGLSAFETQLGVKIKADLVDSLGESMVFYSMPMQSIMGGAPEIYFLLEAKDRDKLEKSVTTLLKFASEQSGHFQFKENAFEGGKSYSLSFPDLKSNPMMANMSPTVAFVDKFLVIGLSKSGVKKVFKRLGSSDLGEGAAAIPDFARFSATFPKDVTGLTYGDMRPTVTALYQAVQMFAPMATSQFPGEFPIDFASLPSAATITKHMFGSAGYSTATETGWQTVSYSSCGVDMLFSFASIGKTLAGIGFGIAAEMESKRHHRGQDDMGDEDEDEPGMPPPPEPPKAPKAMPGPVDLAKQDLLDLKSGITIFKIETGKYPNSLEDLLRTSNELPEGCLPGRKSIPLDPWKQPYIFSLDAANKTYKLRSKGPNGVDDLGKGDDVVGN